MLFVPELESYSTPVWSCLDVAYRVFLKSMVRGGFCFCDESNGDFRYVTNNDRLHQICGTSDLNLFIKLQQRNYALIIKMVEEVDQLSHFSIRWLTMKNDSIDQLCNISLGKKIGRST